MHGTYNKYFGPQHRCKLSTRAAALKCERQKYDVLNFHLMDKWGDDLHSVPLAWKQQSPQQEAEIAMKEKRLHSAGSMLWGKSPA